MAVSYTTDELTIWRARTSDANYSWIWNDIRSRANSVLSGTYDQYTQFTNSSYYVNGRWPTLSTDSTKANAIEPRPETSSSQSLLMAAFCYLLGPSATGFSQPQLEDMRTRIINEIVRYAGDSRLNYDNNEGAGGSYIFPWFDSVNPGFFLCEWMTKLLNAYQYIGGQGTNATCDAWFTKWANYCIGNLNRALNGHLPNRLSRSYSAINLGWSNTNIGSMWNGSGLTVYGLNGLFNNRLVAYVRFLSIYSFMYNNSAMKLYVKNTFKEFIAYGSFRDSDWHEYQRSNADDPEAVTRYGGVSVGSLSEIADVFARNGDFDLYNYEINNTIPPGETISEYSRFAANATHVGVLFALQSNKSKSLYLLIDQFLKLFDSTYSRYKGGTTSEYLINGATNIWYGGTWAQDYITDQFFRQCNVWYQDANWKTIYNRTKSGTRTLDTSRNIGSFKQIYGIWGTIPSQFFMYQDVEDLINPYGGVTPPQPDPSFTPVSKRNVVTMITKRRILR